MAKYLSCESSAGRKKLQSFVFVFPVSPSFRLCENLRALQFLCGRGWGGKETLFFVFPGKTLYVRTAKCRLFHAAPGGKRKMWVLAVNGPRPPAFSGGGIILNLWRAMHLFWVNHYTFRCSCSFSVMGQGSRGGGRNMTLCAFFAFWSKKRTWLRHG